MQKYLVLVLVFISIFSKAQVAAELSPKSLILPRLSTSQQNTLPPQQAGNVVFNADEKKLAVHDGNQWNYIGGSVYSSQYSNQRGFSSNSSWIVPSGVQKIIVELWGGGSAGQTINSVGANVSCIGGSGGEYTMYELSVSSNEVLNITVGQAALNSTTAAGTSYVGSDVRGYIAQAQGGRSYGGEESPLTIKSGLVKFVPGESGSAAKFSFQAVDAGTWRKIIETGRGGGTYPSFKNGGQSSTLEFSVPDGVYIGGSLPHTAARIGGFPGGGGGCGYAGTGAGANGYVLIHY